MKTVTFDEKLWQVVPKEPTGFMLNAAEPITTRIGTQNVYSAMLSAAPSPADAQPVDPAGVYTGLDREYGYHTLSLNKDLPEGTQLYAELPAPADSVNENPVSLVWDVFKDKEWCMAATSILNCDARFVKDELVKHGYSQDLSVSLRHCVNKDGNPVVALIGEVERLRAESVNTRLLDALNTLRKSFLIAVGDKSPFARLALSGADKAIAAAEQQAQPELSGEYLTRVYKQANGIAGGKSRPISTQHIFNAMRAIAADRELRSAK